AISVLNDLTHDRSYSDSGCVIGESSALVSNSTRSITSNTTRRSGKMTVMYTTNQGMSVSVPLALGLLRHLFHDALGQTADCVKLRALLPHLGQERLGIRVNESHSRQIHHDRALA